MATTTMKKTTATKTVSPKTPASKVEAKEVKEVVEEVKESSETIGSEEIVAEEVKVSKKEPRKYEATDAIPCESITSGELGMIGIKSHINYRWADRNDVTEVEYQDIVAAIRSGADFIRKPYFIIRDEELIKQFPQVSSVYENLYNIHDLKDILRGDIGSMVSTIEILPEGAKQSIKNLAATMIQNGTLDSVNKIKKLDEMFGTRLMLMTDLLND